MPVSLMYRRLELFILRAAAVPLQHVTFPSLLCIRIIFYFLRSIGVCYVGETAPAMPSAFHLIFVL